MRNVEFYITPYRRRSDGEWVTCAINGDAISAEEIMAPDNTPEKTLGEFWLISDSAIMYQLPSDLKSTQATSQSILLANLKGEFGVIEGDLPYAKFIENRDNFMLGLSIRPPRERLSHYPEELEAPDSRIYAWGGFLTGSEFVFGGDYIQLDFKDYTYWSGNILIGRDFIQEKRTDILEYIADLCPFIVGNPFVGTDNGVDEDVTDFREVIDLNNYLDPITGFAPILTSPTGTTPLEILEYVYWKANQLFVRTEDAYYIIDLTGISPPVEVATGMAPASLAFPPEDDSKPIWWLYDPTQKGTLCSLAVLPRRMDKSPPSVISTNYPQDFIWSTNRCVYMRGLSGPDLEVWSCEAVPTAMAYAHHVFTYRLMDGAEEGTRGEWTIIADNSSDHFVIASAKNSKKIYIFDVTATGTSTMNRTYWNLGHVTQYIADREYPFIGKRPDGTYFWLKTGAGASLSVLDAGDINSQFDALPPNCCYPFNTEKYPNHICYFEAGEEDSYLVIVDKYFRIKERLYAGPRTTPETHITLNMDDNEYPLIMGNKPTGILSSDLTIWIAKPKIPNALARLDAKEISIGAGLSKMAKCFSAWFWLMPNMRLWFKNFGADSGVTGIDLKPETRLKAGNEDSISYWGQQFEQIKCEFGADRQVSIGNNLWNHKTKSLDLKEVIYSADHARMLTLQNYLIYHPFRQQIKSPLYRGSMFLLWNAFRLHKDWSTILTRIDLGSLVSEIQGIKPPIMLGTVFEQMDLWIDAFWWDIQHFWIFCDCHEYGCDIIPPEPWCCGFVGDNPAGDGTMPGYPVPARTLLHELMEQIMADINEDEWPETSDFSTWWDIHYFEYWDEIYAIILALQAAGYWT